jgi:hypothetical protein
MRQQKWYTASTRLRKSLVPSGGGDAAFFHRTTGSRKTVEPKESGSPTHALCSLWEGSWEVECWRKHPERAPQCDVCGKKGHTKGHSAWDREEKTEQGHVAFERRQFYGNLQF